MRFQLYSLKDLMEDFYISEISSILEVNPDDIEYQDSQTITINGKSVETLLSVKQTSKKKVFRDAESRVLNYLRTFSCTLNEDVQNFLHHEDKCIRMQKESTSRTYLIIDSEKDAIAAYFAIAFKPIILKKQLMINDKKKEKLPVNSNEIGDVEVLPTILIGQIGRDDAYSKKDIDVNYHHL